MESTGKHWVPVFNLLEDEINVTIANPKWVKAVKGNKDDTKIDMPEILKEKQKEKAIKQAKKLLITEGIINESPLAS